MSPSTAAAPVLDPEMLLPELLLQSPQTRGVFDRYGLRGCGGQLGPHETLRFFARTHGVPEERLLRELAEAIAQGQLPQVAQTLPGDSIYRRFFLAGIAVILTAGASWGAIIHWKIGFSGKFTGATIHEVNAHGHAQIYGWVGLFIMGFSLQAFPRLWHTELWRPGVAVFSFIALLLGLVIRTTGMMLHPLEAGLPLAMLGGALEIAAVLGYALVIVQTFLRSQAPAQLRTQPYLAFALAAVAYFIGSSLLDVWHTFTTMSAGTREEMLYYVATYQAPLRDLQIHGLALCMIFGVSLRMLPALFEVPELSVRRQWWVFALLNFAVLSEVLVFIGYRWTESHALAATLLLPWLALTVGCSLVVCAWTPWRAFKVQERSAKFVRAALIWLMISLAMLLLMPLYQVLSGIAFSHAYYGAIRHAITVGCVSLMIMGFAAKVVPTLDGIDTRTLSALWLPFVLVNLGCFLRCSLQILTDWQPAFFALVGISGLLEVTGLAVWGFGLIGIMLRKEQGAEERAERPAQIKAEHRVASILNWFPETEQVFLMFGFHAIQNPLLRRTLARQVSLQQVCALRKVELSALLEALNAVVTLTPAPEDLAQCPPSNCSACAQSCHQN